MEMIASVLIIAISTALFVYWFRYTCVLILNTRTSKDYTVEVASANQLSFLDVQTALHEESSSGLDRLQVALDRDYRVVNYLLRHTSELEFGGASLEQHMLRVDFWIMRTCFRVAHRVSEAAARAAVQEMSAIIAHFANAFGERLATESDPA
jgi:hypothetical protein